MKIDLVIVDDGSGYEWVCEREDLIKALKKLDWEFSKDEIHTRVTYWEEPANEFDYEAYGELCENVYSLREGSEVTGDDYELPAYRPDIEEGVWVLDK